MNPLKRNPGTPGHPQRNCRLWLTWKLIRNQQLRTAAIFCGLLFSCFLLEAFGSFGYDFWTQVHGGGDGETAVYDQTQLILLSLVTVLLLLVAACAGILLHNLYSLTFAQRWRSLTRLLELGAGPRDIIRMALLENILLCGVSMPLGCLLTMAATSCIGIQSAAPFWLTGGILLWIGTVSCLCSIHPLWTALRSSSHGRSSSHRCSSSHECSSSHKRSSSHGRSSCHGRSSRPEGSSEPRPRHLRLKSPRPRSSPSAGLLNAASSFEGFLNAGSPSAGLLNSDSPSAGLPNSSSSSAGFRRFMIRKYRLADRSRHRRIILTILAAILLYVPACYLIETNLSVQRVGLDTAYGIQYDCTPQNRQELAASLTECRQLASRTPSVIYVSLPASASVKASLLSRELLGILESAGWQENDAFVADSALFFLEDQAYRAYLESCLENQAHGTDPESCLENQTHGTDPESCLENQAHGTNPESCLENQTHGTDPEPCLVKSTSDDSHAFTPAILIDRYINRSRWSEDAVLSYQEVPLLDGQKDYSGIEIYYETTGDPQRDLHWNPEKSLLPDMAAGELPEGLDFGGELSVILPLSRLEDFLPRTGFPDLSVYGRFQDPEETSFSELESILGKNALGRLRYTRKILQEWYDSMSGIHKAMTAICVLLFFMAALNIFSMLFFQYIERKKGLAVLWSLGASPGELLRILAWEHIRNLLAAIILGIPLSGILCYYIYSIFRQVWRMDFAFPLRQTALITAAAGILSGAAVLTERLLMGRQDFLHDIKAGEVSGGIL